MFCVGMEQRTIFLIELALLRSLMTFLWSPIFLYKVARYLLLHFLTRAIPEEADKESGIGVPGIHGRVYLITSFNLWLITIGDQHVCYSFSSIWCFPHFLIWATQGKKIILIG